MNDVNNLEQVYYVSVENSPELVDREKICVRDISSVSDYLRAITMIHSNYFILKYGAGTDIRRYENMFSRPETKHALNNIVTNGVYFRGQTKDYGFVIPSLYRDLESIKFENEFIKRAEISCPNELNAIPSFLSKLALMQHYGLRTRILDITTNALVALYFAVEDGDIQPTNPEYDNVSDGVVFLYKKETPEIEVEASEKISTKANISQLNFSDKIKLYQAIGNQAIDDDADLVTFFENNIEISEILKKLVNYVRKDLGYTPTKILKSYLIGADIVYASEVDSRIIRQNGLFVIWGLDGLSHIEESGEGALKDIQEDIDKSLKDKEILYSPEGYTNLSGGAGYARIKIKKEYKAQLLAELKLLGITGQSIYPDLQHKLEYVNNLSMEK